MLFPICEGEPVMALESREVTRASRRVEEGLWRSFSGGGARRSNQSILKEISPGISLEGMMLQLKLQYFGPRGWQCPFVLCLHPQGCLRRGVRAFRMDWLDLLAVQGTLKSLPQHHSSKASILRHSAFFTVQLSHPYMSSHWLPTGPTRMTRVSTLSGTSSGPF